MQNEIKELIGLWTKAISIDHHKSKDCYFYIETKYSSEEVEHRAVHYGYVAGDYIGPAKATYEEATADLLALLKKMLKDHYAWALMMSKDPDEMEWNGDIIDHVKETLEPYFKYEQLELKFGE